MAFSESKADILKGSWLNGTATEKMMKTCPLGEWLNRAEDLKGTVQKLIVYVSLKYNVIRLKSRPVPKQEISLLVKLKSEQTTGKN